MLREQVLGKERFDRAFRTYTERWAFKHPQPDDFFRTMENVGGESLNWFWRAWFVNNWKLDQAISKIKYIKNDPKLGTIISIENLEKMAMPVTLEVKTKSGKSSRIQLPVEIWQRNNDWSFKNSSTEEIESIIIDPDHVLPDMNEENNVWKAGTSLVEEDVILDGFLGTFSSKLIPIKITFTEENGVLLGQATGQPQFPLLNVAKNKFTIEGAPIEITFNDDRSEFTLAQAGKSFVFSREK